MNRIRTIVILAAFVAAGTLATGARAGLGAPDASPSPAATSSPEASPKPDRATRLHRGIVICQAAPLLSWPDHNGVPSGNSYPAARMGDSIQVIGDGTLAYDGRTYYETTIDVLAPYGAGKHYYIPAECINAA